MRPQPKNTHSILGESIRHAVAGALHFTTNLDKDCTELAEDTGDGRLKGAVVLGLGQTVGFQCQCCSGSERRCNDDSAKDEEIDSKRKRKDDMDLLGNKDAGARRIDDLGVNITDLVAG